MLFTIIPHASVKYFLAIAFCHLFQMAGTLAFLHQIKMENDFANNHAPYIQFYYCHYLHDHKEPIPAKHIGAWD